MGAGEIILSRTGKQTEYINKKSEITLFKTGYKRHTNFCKEFIKYSIPSASWGKTCEINFSCSQNADKNSNILNCDLLSKLVLEIAVPSISVSGPVSVLKWTNNLGHAIIKDIELYIGETLVDKQNGEFLEIASQLNLKDGKYTAYSNLIGNNTLSSTDNSDSIKSQLLYIPLNFWFCKDLGVSLPIVAMQQETIKIKITFRAFKELHHTAHASNVITGSDIVNASLIATTYYVDNDEKRLFAEQGHKYLITQVQTNSFNLPNENIKLDIHNNIKELYWIGQRKITADSTYRLYLNSFYDYNNHFNYVSSPSYNDGYNMFESFRIIVDNNYYVSEKESSFFNMYIPFKYYNKCPNNGIYVYSFSEKPNMIQPSGYLPVSNIRNLLLKVKTNNATTDDIVLRVYAITYNILYINEDNKGQVRLAYSYPQVSGTNY